MSGTIFFIIMAMIGIKIMIMLAEKKAKDDAKKRLFNTTGMTTERAKKIYERSKREEKNKTTIDYKTLIENSKEKGNQYEYHVAEYFRKQGYRIAEHGRDNGKKDHGIDVIAKREKEIIFIQCKNWEVTVKYKIDHRHIKEFIGNCTTYIEKNPMYNNYTIRRYYAIPDEIMEYSAERFISENPQSIQKLLLPMSVNF